MKLTECYSKSSKCDDGEEENTCGKVFCQHVNLTVVVAYRNNQND